MIVNLSFLINISLPIRALFLPGKLLMILVLKSARLYIEETPEPNSAAEASYVDTKEVTKDKPTV